jgi:hypothetical protein
MSDFPEHLNILADASDPGFLGWQLHLSAIGPLVVQTGRLCIADPLSDPGNFPEFPNDTFSVQLILLQADGRPATARVAAVLLERWPGRPQKWVSVKAIAISDFILLCDADTRWRIDELTEDGAFAEGFISDILLPTMLVQGKVRLWGRHALMDSSHGKQHEVLFVQNGNNEGAYTLWAGQNQQGETLCWLLDLGLVD